MALYFGERARKCIVPDDKWDGDTGIPQQLKSYRDFGFFKIDPAEEERQRQKARADQMRKRMEKKTPMRTCSVCGVAKPLTEFRCANNPYSYRKRCQACFDAETKRREQLREERARERKLKAEAARRKAKEKKRMAEVAKKQIVQLDITITEKKCKCCGRVLPLSRFTRNGKYYRPECKSCRQDKVHGKRTVATEKTCSKCGRVLPASAFKPNKASRDGLHYLCIKCAIEHAKMMNSKHRNKTNP